MKTSFFFLNRKSASKHNGRRWALIYFRPAHRRDAPAARSFFCDGQSTPICKFAQIYANIGTGGGGGGGRGRLGRLIDPLIDFLFVFFFFGPFGSRKNSIDSFFY